MNTTTTRAIAKHVTQPARAASSRLSLYGYDSEKGYILRLIELMNRGPAYQGGVSLSTLSKRATWDSEHVGKQEILDVLQARGTTSPITNVQGHNGHVEYFNVSGLKIPIGIVAQHSSNYACTRGRCHKIRVSPDGYGTHCTNWCSGGKDLHDDNVSKLVDDVAVLIGRKDKWRANPDEFPLVRAPNYDKFRFARDKGPFSG
jgi:molybdenum cofactor biosynthesis enzyme MoaA